MQALSVKTWQVLSKLIVYMCKEPFLATEDTEFPRLNYLCLSTEF